jgi:hypothetical protein
MIISRKPFLEALSKCLQLTRKKHVIEQLTCVEIATINVPKSNKGSVSVRATDLETSLSFTLTAVEPDMPLDWQGNLLVQCEKLKSLVAALKCEEVFLEKKDGKLHVSGDGIAGDFVLSVMSGDLPRSKEEAENPGSEPGSDTGGIGEFSFEWDNSCRLLQRVMAKNSGDPDKASTSVGINLNSLVAFSIKNRSICVYCTDGALGGAESTEVVGSQNLRFDFELFVKEAKLLAEMEGGVEISVTKNSVRCFQKKDNYSMEAVFRRPAGEWTASGDTIRKGFADMLELVKSKFNSRAAINKKDLIEAVDRVTICATAAQKKDFMLDLLMILSDNGVKISHPDSDTEEIITDVEFEGEPGRFSFNPDLLKNILAEQGDILELSYDHEMVKKGRNLMRIAIKDQDNEKYCGFIAGRM